MTCCERDARRRCREVRAYVAAGLLACLAGWAAAAPVGPEFQVNTYTTSLQFLPRVASDGADGFVVVWESFGSFGTDASIRSVQAQHYDGDGAPLGGQFQVNTYTTSGQVYADVASDGAGGFVVAWTSVGSAGTDASGWSVQAQRYDGSATPVGGEFQVNTYTTGNQSWPSMAPHGGGFVVVWHSAGSAGSDSSDYGVQGQRYDGSGAAVGGQFQVNTYTPGRQYLPVVAPSGAGGFVVVWQSYGSAGTDSSQRSIQGQRYDGDGAPVGGEFQVNTYTTGIQGWPKVAEDGAGGFMVVWHSSGNGGSVQARRYDGSGAPVGGEFQVNTYTTGFQAFPAVAGDGAGGVVVVWGGGGETDANGIQAQRYDASGMPLGGQFQVNTYTTSGQGWPSVTGGPGGGFVVAWQSGEFGTDSANAIVGQRFADLATTTTSTSSSTTSTTLPPGTCPALPSGGCQASFAKALLLVRENAPGRERLTARFSVGPPMIGTDFGDPLLGGGTDYALCLYDDGGGLVGEYVVDRAGAVCGARPCWKGLGTPPGDKGYRYRDAATAADGILVVLLGAGDPSKVLVKGRNDDAKGQLALPMGVAAALAGSLAPTLQLFGSDAPGCLSVTLSRVLRDDGTEYKAKTP